MAQQPQYPHSSRMSIRLCLISLLGLSCIFVGRMLIADPFKSINQGLSVFQSPVQAMSAIHGPVFYQPALILNQTRKLGSNSSESSHAMKTTPNNRVKETTIRSSPLEKKDHDQSLLDSPGATKTKKQNRGMMLVDYNMEQTSKKSIHQLLLPKENDPKDPYACPMNLSYTINGTRVSKCRKAAGNGTDLIIDIVSIGSKHRVEYLNAQYSTWASHPSVRNFVGVTEADDVDPYCEINMTATRLRQQLEMCRQRHKKAGQLLLYRYMPATFLTKKANPFGWLCAQVRPGTALGKIGRYYKTLPESKLPDYLLLVDDDTMIRMDTLVNELQRYNSSLPRVWAGCLSLKSRFEIYRFSPNGGAGTYFSKGAVQRLLTPLNCKNADQSEYTQMICKRVLSNRFYELPFQEEGLSLAEHAFMYFNRWPNCFVSDWLVGHYANYFQLGDEWSEVINSSDWSRIHPYLRSFIFLDGLNLKMPMIKNQGRGCECNSGCNDPELPICHYVDPEKMRNFTATWLSLP